MRLTDLITKHKNWWSTKTQNIFFLAKRKASPICPLPLWGRAGVGAADNPRSDSYIPPSPAKRDWNSSCVARQVFAREARERDRVGVYKTRAATAFTILTACLLTACGSVPDTYHSLRPDIDHPPTQQGTPTAIRYTELPTYYEREYLVWYDEHDRITRDKSQHWTYPFADNLRDVLRQGIAAATGNSRTYTYPLAENNRAETLIDIQIRELIAEPRKQRYRVSAQWQVSQADSDAAPVNHEYQEYLPLPKSDPDSIVAATAQAVNRLAAAIARSL